MNLLPKWIFASILVLTISGCKDTYKAVDKAASEVTGQRAVMQSQGVKEKIRAAEKMQKEREEKMKSMVEEMNK